MRTSVDLSPAVLARANRLAKQRRQSISELLEELIARGLVELDEPVERTTEGEPTEH